MMHTWHRHIKRTCWVLFDLKSALFSQTNTFTSQNYLKDLQIRTIDLIVHLWILRLYQSITEKNKPQNQTVLSCCRPIQKFHFLLYKYSLNPAEATSVFGGCDVHVREHQGVAAFVCILSFKRASLSLTKSLNRLTNKADTKVWH